MQKGQLIMPLNRTFLNEKRIEYIENSFHQNARLKLKKKD